LDWIGLDWIEECVLKSFPLVCLIFVRLYNSSDLLETNDVVQSIINMLDQPDIDSIVRLADIYGFLVDHFVRVKDMNEVCRTVWN